MLPYILLITVPIIVWCWDKFVQLDRDLPWSYKAKSSSITFFMLILLVLLSCRGLFCGNDTIQYLRIFKQYSSTTIDRLLSDGTQEVGYKILNWLVGSMTNNYQYLLFATSLICILPLWYFYKKESEMPVLTIALFLTVSPFSMYFSGIRQAIAMSIGILAWYAAKNKKPVRFLCIVGLAMMFHTSSFILVLLYPLYHVRITKSWLWFVLPAMAMVYVFRDEIFSFALELLWKDYEVTKETGAFMILLLLVLFAVYSYIMVEDKTLDQDTIGMRNLLLLSVVLQIFAMLHPLSMRMNYYFLIFVPILIPKIAKRCKKQFVNLSAISVVVMTVYFLYYFVNMMITDVDHLNIFPYIPFWKN